MQGLDLGRCAAAAAVLLLTALAAPTAEADRFIDNDVVMLGFHQDMAVFHGRTEEVPPNCDMSSTNGVHQKVGFRYMSPPGTTCDALAGANPGPSGGADFNGWGLAFDGIHAGCQDRHTAPCGLGAVSVTDDCPVCSEFRHEAQVVAGQGIHVVHEFTPNTTIDRVYDVAITIENQDPITHTDILYRRFFDLNVQPTMQNEMVSISGLLPIPDTVRWTSNNGQPPADPLAHFDPDYNPWGCHNSTLGPGTLSSSLGGGAFTNVGPCDQGLTFDFALGDLAPGASRQFTMFMGVHNDESQALALIDDLGAELWGYAQPATGAYTENTFFIAWKGLGPPIPDFSWSPRPVCGGTSVTFTDLSTGVTYPLDTMEWDFGDGTSSGGVPYSSSITHTYPSPPSGANVTYPVDLTVWDTSGWSRSVTKEVVVLGCQPPPPDDLPPVLEAPPCASIAQHGNVALHFRATDPNSPPDPDAYFTLDMAAVRLPAGADFDTTTGMLVWNDAQPPGTHRFTVRVWEAAYPDMADEAEGCITVLPPKPVPEASDADRDGAPDLHDSCPSLPNPTQQGGCDAVGLPAAGQDPSGPAGIGCALDDLRPSDVAAAVEPGPEVLITWRAAQGCQVDRFLVWNGTSGRNLVAVVPYEPGREVYSALDEDPWPRPHRYYVQAEATAGKDVFVYMLAVATDAVGMDLCDTCPSSELPLPGEDAADDAGPSMTASTKPWTWALLGGVALLAASVWAALHVGSFGFVRAFSRLRRDQVASHPLRQQILDSIAERPGIHFRALIRLMGRPARTVEHHLQILENAKQIRKVRSSGYVCYFRSGVNDPELLRVAGLLRVDLARRLAAHLAAVPKAFVAELAETMDAGYGAVSHHLVRFQKAGLVRLQDTEGRLQVSMTPLARQIIGPAGAIRTATDRPGPQARS